MVIKMEHLVSLYVSNDWYIYRKGPNTSFFPKKQKRHIIIVFYFFIIDGMNYSDYQYIEKFVAILMILWLWYIIKLYMDYGFSIWLLALFVGIYAILSVFILAFVKKKSPYKEYEYSLVDNIDKPKTLMEKLKAMHPKDFEDFIKLLFELQWYVVIYKSFWKRRVPHKDWGIDMIVVRDNKKIYVQIKKNIANMVSVEMVRAFYWSIVNRLKSQDKWLFVRTSVFSQDAEKFAKENNMETISYQELEKEIVWLEKEIQKREKIEYFLAKINYYQNKKYNQNIRTCPKCGAADEIRTRDILRHRQAL